MIKQMPIQVGDKKVMLICNTTEKRYSIMNTHVKNKKGNSSGNFMFVNSFDIQANLEVIECLRLAVIKAKELIEADNIK